MKNLNRLLILIFIISVLSSCNFSQTTPNTGDKAQIQINKTIDNSKPNKEKDNEITGCTEKTFKGETIKILFKKEHGDNFAIISEKRRNYFFLTDNNAKDYPKMSSDKFGSLSTFELSISEVRYSSEEIRDGVFSKSKPFFSKTGWYWILIGHQGLDVDFEDAINGSSGRCRVFYENKKRPKKK